eukprot:167678-Hanusia_phi.AAC.2
MGGGVEIFVPWVGVVGPPPLAVGQGYQKCPSGWVLRGGFTGTGVRGPLSGCMVPHCGYIVEGGYPSNLVHPEGRCSSGMPRFRGDRVGGRCFVDIDPCDAGMEEKATKRNSLRQVRGEKDAWRK